MQPSTVAKIAARHGVAVTEEEVRRRYAYQDFVEFIETFKWVTSFLRQPADYAVIVNDFAEALLAQRVVYAEVTLSIGVMQLRGQDPQANFAAMLEAAEAFERRGLRLRWVWDAVRQFGVEAAMAVVEAAGRCRNDKIVAFGIGGPGIFNMVTALAAARADRSAVLAINAAFPRGIFAPSMAARRSSACTA